MPGTDHFYGQYPDEIKVLPVNAFYNVHENYYFGNVDETKVNTYEGCYAQHLWGQSNSAVLETFNATYYCHSKVCWGGLGWAGKVVGPSMPLSTVTARCVGEG